MYVPLAEKYRPKKLDQVLGQSHVVNVLKKFVAKGDIPHMLFLGPPGVGKTTVAHALANELGWSIVEFNASDERGINVIREDIKNLAFSRGKKIILLDEADNMTEDAQHALRRIMEKSVVANTRFILTGNNEWKIIDALKSRCVIFRFEKLPSELIVKRLAEIAVAEGVTITSEEQFNELKKALLMIVEVSEGDMRKALNYLETLIASKQEITPDLVKSLIKVGIVTEAVYKALEGNLDSAVEMLENALVSSRLDIQSVLSEMYKALMRIDNPKIKAKALLELARAEHAIKMGGSPVIQLTGVLASVWMLRLSGA